MFGSVRLKRSRLSDALGLVDVEAVNLDHAGVAGQLDELNSTRERRDRRGASGAEVFTTIAASGRRRRTAWMTSMVRDVWPKPCPET